MPKIKYIDRDFSPDVLAMIFHANKIIQEYESDGYALTLRQLFYKFVSRNILPNTERSYKNLGSWVNDGRLAGLIDWGDIQDRTRGLESRSHWTEPADIMKTVSKQFMVDMWERQKFRPEVWIEKDALVGVIERVCWELDVPYLSCRGYTSQSEMWTGGQRIQEWAENSGQTPVIFHLGDHDPSGKDMSRDIVKVTDSRSSAYIAEFGRECWELDALEPKFMVSLIRTAVEALIDKKRWKQDEARLADCRKRLATVSDNWDDVEQFLRKKKGRK
jgi:hypothetical protein